jgi:hypothetical protein
MQVASKPPDLLQSMSHKPILSGQAINAVWVEDADCWRNSRGDCADTDAIVAACKRAHTMTHASAAGPTYRELPLQRSQRLDLLIHLGQWQ